MPRGLVSVSLYVDDRAIASADTDRTGRAVAIAYAREGANILVSYLTAGMAQLLAERGVRVNAGAPGPMETPLTLSSMPK